MHEAACTKPYTRKDKVRKHGPHPGPEGAFEFQPFQNPSPKTLMGTGNGGGANLEFEGIGGFTCSTTAAEGELTGPKTAGNTVITFTGCELLHHKCESEQAGVKEGEIKTNPLKAEIGYLGYIEPHLVGVALFAEGAYFAEFHCTEIAYRWSGSIIGEIETGASSAYNKFSMNLTLRFEQAAGHQEWVTLEGVPGGHVLVTETSDWPSPKEWSLPMATGWETTVSETGEDLYLKA